MTIYESMEKPFQKQEDKDKLIDAYVNHSSLYSGLVKSHCDQKIKGAYSISSCDQFYVQIFQDWKNALRTLVLKDLVKPEYKEQLYRVYRYIGNLNPKTREEVMEIIDYEKINDPLLKSGIEIFRWNSIGEFSGWNHIHSNCVKHGISQRQVIQHRLYLNCDSTVTHKIMLRFIQKCNERNSAYYFKYDSFGARDDNLVFYCDTKHLSTYLEILKEIMQEEKLRDHVYDPPLCTAKIDGWIGYGSEPFTKEDEENISFNEKREELIEKCIKEVSDSWLLRHMNTHLTINGKDVPYQYVFISCVVEETMKHIMSHATNSENCRKCRGYTLNDLKRVDLRNYIYENLRKNFDKILNYFKHPDKKFLVEFPFLNGNLYFNHRILEEVRKKQVKFYWDHSNLFQKELMEKIRSSSRSYGIDPDNFACDLYVVDELGKKSSESSSIKIDIHGPVSEEKSYVSYRKSKTGNTYTPMSEEEILKSQQKLGFI